MKDVMELLEKKSVFLDGFKDESSIIENFFEKEVEKSDIFDKVLFAVYETYWYEGYALVIFSKGGTLYEVHGSHCSCYGLEGQWNPEEISLNEMAHRLKNGNMNKFECEDVLYKLKELFEVE